MIRFLHTADLHLGKPFGRFSEELRGRLRETRHASIERLAAAARVHGATEILVAGDTFDSQTPVAGDSSAGVARDGGRPGSPLVAPAGQPRQPRRRRPLAADRP